MTSLTQRSSGLVQRRTEASRSAAADKERGAGGGSEDEGRREEPGDDEKGDSKETRLTLMEEVLLLGLKDREVRTKGGRGGPGGGTAITGSVCGGTVVGEGICRALGGLRWRWCGGGGAGGGGEPHQALETTLRCGRQRRVGVPGGGTAAGLRPG